MGRNVAEMAHFSLSVPANYVKEMWAYFQQRRGDDYTDEESIT